MKRPVEALIYTVQNLLYSLIGREPLFQNWPFCTFWILPSPSESPLSLLPTKLLSSLNKRLSYSFSVSLDFASNALLTPKSHSVKTSPPARLAKHFLVGSLRKSMLSCLGMFAHTPKTIACPHACFYHLSTRIIGSSALMISRSDRWSGQRSSGFSSWWFGWNSQQPRWRPCGRWSCPSTHC